MYIKIYILIKNHVREKCHFVCFFKSQKQGFKTLDSKQCEYTKYRLTTLNWFRWESSASKIFQTLYKCQDKKFGSKQAMYKPWPLIAGKLKCTMKFSFQYCLLKICLRNINKCG